MLRENFVLIYNDTLEAICFVLAWMIVFPLLIWYKLVVPALLFFTATAMVLKRRSRRHYMRAWNAMIRTFLLWPTEQAVRFSIWWIALRQGWHEAEKKAYIEKLRAQYPNDALPQKLLQA